MKKLVLTPSELNQNQERTLNRLLQKNKSWLHHPFQDLEALLKDLMEHPDATIFPLFLNRDLIDLLIEVQKLEVWPQMRSKWHSYPASSLEYLLYPELFQAQLEHLGLNMTKSQLIYGWEDLQERLEDLSFPVLLRDSLQMHGQEPITVGNTEELQAAYESFQDLVLPLPYYIESPMKGLREIELVLVRDSFDSSFILGTAEHIEPVGLHRDDATLVFPAQSLADSALQFLRNYSIRLARGLGLQGIISLRFAWNPKKEQAFLLQVGLGLNDSALMMSQILRLPMAELMLHILEGKSVQSMPGWKAGEPAMDYLVARFPLDFSQELAGDSGLTRQSTGQFYAYARNLEATLLKGLAVLEARVDIPLERLSEEDLIDHLVRQRSDRLLYLLEALRRGLSVAYIQGLTHIDPLFLEALKGVVALEKELSHNPGDLDQLRQAKAFGLSDRRIAQLWKESEENIWDLRVAEGILPTYKEIEGWVGFAVAYYSSYEMENEAQQSVHPSTVFLYSDQDPWLGQELWKESILVGSNSPLEAGLKQYLEPLIPELIDQVLLLEDPDKLYGSPEIRSLNLRNFYTRDGID